MKQQTIVTFAPTLLRDYKLRSIRVLCGGEQMQCAIVVVWCSVSVRPVRLPFAELLRHKPTLHDLGILGPPPKKKARIYGTEIDLS